MAVVPEAGHSEEEGRGKEYKIEEILETYAEEREGRRLTSFRVRTHEGVFKIYYCGEEGRWYWER